jgi:vacuolar-type H+-ATPase subunit H
MRPYDDINTPRSETDPRYPAGAMPLAATGEGEAPEELQADIAETRAELDATVDAIQERLSPEYLKSQAKDVVHDAADQARAIIRDATEQAKDIVHEAVHDATEQAKGAVHDATVGKAEEAVSGAARTARSYSSTVMDTIKQNPLPAALVGIGLGWMYFKRQSASTDTQTSGPAYRNRWTGEGTFGGGQRFVQPPRYGASPYGAYGQTGWRSDQAQGNGAQAMNRMQDRAGQFVDRAQDGAGQFADRVQDGAGQMADRVQNSAGQFVDRVQGTAAQFADQAQEVADQAQQRAGQVVDTVQERAQQVTGTAQGQFQRMLRESPLTLGGIAIAAGLAVGFAIPATDKEDQLLGETRDNLVQQAKETAQEAQQKLQQVAQEAGKAAQNEAKEQHLTA